MTNKTMLAIGITLLMTFAPFLQAAEQSRDAFLESMKSDLLTPCADSKFMECIGSNKSECVVRINNLMRDCRITLPAVLTDSNRDASADDFSVCFSKGIINKFSVSEEKYNTCLAQKPK